MKPTQTDKFSLLQREVLAEQSPADVLKSFIRNPKNRLLSLQNGYLLIIPSWQAPGMNAWNLQSLYTEIKYIFRSRLLAQKICTGHGTNAELEAVTNWLLNWRQR